MAYSNLKFAANISTMFTEAKFVRRFDLARQHGFRAVECQFPYEKAPEYLQRIKLKAGVEHILINSHPGTSGERGFGIACVPGSEIQYVNTMSRTLEYALDLGVKKVHILGGSVNVNKHRLEDHYDVYKSNLKGTLEMLEDNNLTGLIEPLCPEVNETYILSSFDQAVEIVKEIDSPHLKILLDIYHLHMLHGDVLAGIKRYYPYSGHIQVSQAPSRHELDYPGDIDYRQVFSLLEELGHTDWIGLEYTPSGRTADSLKWVEEFGCHL